jgi:hypothetical protein
MEQGNARELEWLFLVCEATLTLENNSIVEKNVTHRGILVTRGSGALLR